MLKMTRLYIRELEGKFEKEPYSELGSYQELVQEDNKSGGRLL
jgi:hypothetical protein